MLAHTTKANVPVPLQPGLSDQSPPINSFTSVLDLMPLLGKGRANLKAGEKHLVTVLPHDKGTGGTRQCLGQVQHDLEQEVDGECPGDRLTGVDSLVGEGACYGVILIQFAHAVRSQLLTAEAAGL